MASPSDCPPCKNTHLGDDAVELGPLVVQRLAGLAHALLARDQSLEVLDGARDHLAKQPDHALADDLVPDLDLQEGLREEEAETAEEAQSTIRAL